MALTLTIVIFLLTGGATYALLDRRGRDAEFQRRIAQIRTAPAPKDRVNTPAALDGPRAVNFLKRLQERIGRDARRRHFSAQIPDTLLLIAATLRAGHSPARAIQIVAEETPPPMSEEFTRAVAEIGLGLPAAAALSRMSERVRSADWDLVVTAVTTQAQTGGNLAEILERISGTVRERVRVEAETETLTAEGRLSAAILVFLPPVLALVLALRSPHYFLPLTTTPLGHTLILSAVVGQILGTLLLRRMLKLDA